MPRAASYYGHVGAGFGKDDCLIINDGDNDGRARGLALQSEQFYECTCMYSTAAGKLVTRHAQAEANIHKKHKKHKVHE